MENFVRRIRNHVEIPVFLLFFGFMTSDSVQSNLIIFRTCYVTKGFNELECSFLGSENHDNETNILEEKVEPYAAVVSMFNVLGEGFFSALASIFLGPWSDKYGRKPILVLPIFGYFVCYLILAIFSTLENMSPWFSLASLIPIALSGGISTFLTGVCCHITDITHESYRGMKMGIFDGSIYLGLFSGTILSSYLFNACGYTGVFLFSALCCFCSFLYAVFFISESLQDAELEGWFQSLFDWTHITDMVKTTFKKRENYTRFTILSCVVMVVATVIVFNGTRSVFFLFLREKFHWSLHHYTLFSAGSSVLYIVGTVLGVYFLHKKLHIPETILILVALMSSLNGSLLTGLAQSNRIIYTVPIARLLEGIFGPMIRSLISKISPKEDLGKLFSLLTACQFLIGTTGSFFYTLIYNATIHSNPAFFNFISVGIYLFIIVISMSIIAVRTLRPLAPIVYNVMINEESSIEEDEN